MRQGEMVYRFWEALPQRFLTIEMDVFVVMPNHLHGIVVIKPNRATTTVDPYEIDQPYRGQENLCQTPRIGQRQRLTTRNRPM